MLRSLLINDKFILGVILVNALIIFLGGFDLVDELQSSITILDHVITLVFIAEAIAKISSWGRKAYFNSGWNIFDFILVLLALPSLISLFMSSDLISLEYLLAFRVMRVFKFFRFIRFVPNIDKITKGVGRAIKASVLILIAFIIFNFIVSIVSCFLFREIAPEFFSNPLISFYSIFKVFTIEGWYEIPDAIVENTSAVPAFFIRLYFVVILFFGGIFGLSLVNSIFVDSMVSDNNDELEEKVTRLESKIDQLLENKRQS